MGVLNITPDSFSDGGNLYSGGVPDVEAALHRAIQMLSEGAAILDIGGESTRPGAEPVGVQEELDRVLPLVERLAAETPAIISVDTSSPEVITAAAAAGAGLINDVRALTRTGALQAAAATSLPVCLMHMQGQPGTMQQTPRYGDVVNEVLDYLAGRVAACENEGIARTRLLVDPGFGFGKTVAHNLQLLNSLSRLTELQLPVLVGLSRKSMIGKLIGRDVNARMPASIALALLAAERGANIIRTHDVAQTADAVAMWVAMQQQGQQ